MCRQSPDKILLIKRSDNAKVAPGLYSLIGGSLEKNESYRQALVREINEEVGIKTDPNELQFQHVFYRNGTEHELVACVFECTNWQGEPFNKEPMKHTDLLWVTLNDLPQNMIKAHRNVLNLISQKVQYSEQ